MSPTDALSEDHALDALPRLPVSDPKETVARETLDDDDAPAAPLWPLVAVKVIERTCRLCEAATALDALSALPWFELAGIDGSAHPERVDELGRIVKNLKRIRALVSKFDFAYGRCERHGPNARDDE